MSKSLVLIIEDDTEFRQVLANVVKQKISLMVDIGRRKLQIKNILKSNSAVNNSLKLNNLLKMRNGLLHDK